MSLDKSQFHYLKSALERSEGSDEPGSTRAADTLRQVEHYLQVKNHKKAQRKLEEFTRQLIEVLWG